MFRRIKQMFQKNIQKQSAQTDSLFRIQDSDVFIVSFPKSGNTWVRFLIGNYLTEGKIAFTNAHLLIPDVHFNPTAIEAIQTHPRFIKSHSTFSAEYPKVIYVVRDGREACVSYYYFLIKSGVIQREMTFSQFLRMEFIPGNLPYGDWGKHVAGWLDGANAQNILIVKYEDLIANSELELEAIIRFSGLILNASKVREAAQKSTFDEMKKNEEIDPDYAKKMGVHFKDTSYGFMRSGKTNSWKNEFSSEDEELFWQKFGPTMERMGYKREGVMNV